MMKRLALALAALSFGAAAAHAQTPLPPEIRGEITASDPADAEGRRYDELTIEARDGQSLNLTASGGGELRLAIQVFGPAGDRPVAEGGGDRRAEVRLPNLSAGMYRVRVLGTVGTTGSYQLRLARASALGTPSGVGTSPAPARQADHGQEAPDSGRAAFIICPGHPRCPR